MCITPPADRPGPAQEFGFGEPVKVMVPGWPLGLSGRSPSGTTTCGMAGEVGQHQVVLSAEVGVDLRHDFRHLAVGACGCDKPADVYGGSELALPKGHAISNSGEFPGEGVESLKAAAASVLRMRVSGPNGDRFGEVG